MCDIYLEMNVEFHKFHPQTFQISIFTWEARATHSKFNDKRSWLHIAGSGWCTHLQNINCLTNGSNRKGATELPKNALKIKKVQHEMHSQCLQWTLLILSNARFHFSSLYVKTSHFSAAGWETNSTSKWPADQLYNLLCALPPSDNNPAYRQMYRQRTCYFCRTIKPG